MFYIGTGNGQRSWLARLIRSKVNLINLMYRLDTKFRDMKFREISHQEFISYFAKFSVYFAKFRDHLSRNKNENC